ncbi:MAG: septum formation initiator family protein [Thermodesulfobacteriota bacterium]|nr:septum formation initiator family protein [Thermodesulfobacteriota bacterium]
MMRITHAIVYGLVLITILSLSFTLPGEKGLIRLYHLHEELSVIKAQNTSMEKENYTLAQKTFLLRENPSYIEHVIIKEMNMVRPGDIVIVFKKKKKP